MVMNYEQIVNNFSSPTDSPRDQKQQKEFIDMADRNPKTTFKRFLTE